MPLDLLWEGHQQVTLAKANSTASGAKRKAERLGAEFAVLSRKVDRLCLASHAMWALLRDYSDLEEEHIIKKRQEIDLRDGREDNNTGHAHIKHPEYSRQGNLLRTSWIY